MRCNWWLWLWAERVERRHTHASVGRQCTCSTSTICETFDGVVYSTPARSPIVAVFVLPAFRRHPHVDDLVAATHKVVRVA